MVTLLLQISSSSRVIFSTSRLSVLRVRSRCTLLVTIYIPAVLLLSLTPFAFEIIFIFYSSSDFLLCLPVLSAKATTLFRKQTKTMVWGMQTRAVQGMLDFDYVCSRDEPSVAAMVYPFT